MYDPLNPAVTLAVWLRGKCDTSDVPGYLAGHFLGALAAGLVVSILVGPGRDGLSASDAFKDWILCNRFLIPAAIVEISRW